MDYHQNDTERKIFYESYDLPVAFGDVDVDEPNVLMGGFDKEDEKLGVMLGVWKPIQPDQVNFCQEKSYGKMELFLCIDLGLWFTTCNHGCKNFRAWKSNSVSCAFQFCIHDIWQSEWGNFLQSQSKMVLLLKANYKRSIGLSSVYKGDFWKN